MMNKTNQKGSSLTGVLAIIAVVGLYFAAQLWILPSMGVAT